MDFNEHFDEHNLLMFTGSCESQSQSEHGGSEKKEEKKVGEKKKITAEIVTTVLLPVDLLTVTECRHRNLYL